MQLMHDGAGNEVFDQIAALPFPTLAMIHMAFAWAAAPGAGAGLSLSDYGRWGLNQKMALPEVMIGIVPALVVLSAFALIGAMQALDPDATDAVDARKAKLMGLVDGKVTPRRHFINAAKQFFC
jgi:enoyl-CoA hydratase/carnithine racemase